MRIVKLYLQVGFAILQLAGRGQSLPNQKINVGILLEPSWNETLVNQTSFGKENFEIVVISTKDANVRELFSGQCQKLVEKKIVALLGPGNGVIGGIAGELARKMSTPYIGVSPSSSKLIPHQVNVYPERATTAKVVVGLAVEMGSPCIAVFTSNRQSAIVNAMKDQSKSEVISFRVFDVQHGRSPEAEILQISKEIISINKSGSCVVVLDCVMSMAKLIFKASASFDIPTSQFVWAIFNQDYLRDDQIDYGIPLSVVGIREPFSWIRLAEDALMLINISYSNGDVKVAQSSSAATCADPNPSWIDGDRFYRIMLNQNFTGKTGPVQFNNVGDRTAAQYELVRMSESQNGARIWDPIGTAVNSKIFLKSKFWRQSYINSSTSNWIRMVTIVEDPLVIVSKTHIKDNEECVLSHVCIRYKKVPVPGTNATRIESIRSCCIGFVIDVLLLLQTDLGFTAELYFVEDGMYGAYDPITNTWNGMINDLLQGKADLALTTLTINEIRSRVVDYSNPLLYGETKLMLYYSNEQKMDHIEFGFLSPFSTNLWIVLLATVNVILVVVWLLDHFSPYGHYNTQTGRRKFLFDFPACMSYVYSCVFKLQLENGSPRAVSALLVSSVFSFGTLILISTYTANLAASLVNTEEYFTVNSIRDKKFTDPNSGFKFATLKSSSTEMLFSRSTDPSFRQIYENMKPNQVKTYGEGMTKLRNGQLDVFIDDSPFLDLAASKQPDCSFRIVGRPISMQGYGVAFRKSSRWKQPITQLMLKYERRDYFRKLTQKWFAGVCQNTIGNTKTASEMRSGHFSGLFYSCIGAAVVCGLLFILEYALHKFRRKQLKTFKFGKAENSVRDLTASTSDLTSTGQVNFAQFAMLNLPRLREITLSDVSSTHSQETQLSESL